MNIKAFTVATTNIFPIVNSHAGGQLATEWNLRSRESVATDPSVKYHIGPSYTHSQDDFKVTLQLDSIGTVISSTAIQISEGRALVNGHFIESLTPIVIDLAEANIHLAQEGQPQLRGKLVVGLRIMYSTQATMAGSMLAEDQETAIYNGIQVVILPKDGELGTKFTLPSDTPDDETLVNAHLKLAEFEFFNGSITASSIVNNPEKDKLFPADRIGDISSLVSSTYVTKNGLDPKKIYTFSGKGTDPQTGYDTWCDSTDSLIVWDSNPTLETGVNPGVQAAQFAYNPLTGYTVLVLPHKQPDGMSSSSGTPQYYADKLINLPPASFGGMTGGTVTPAYTASIREIEHKIDNMYYLPQGKLRKYINDILTDRSELPPIPTNSTWNPGDYVLVSQDGTLDLDDSVSRLPSTMYVVLPGIVSSIAYVDDSTSPVVVPDDLKDGVQLGYYESQTAVDHTDIPAISSYWDFTTGQYRGIVDKDYFCVCDASDSANLKYYFYKVATAGNKVYSEPVWVTGQIPLATEDAIGGFYNVPANVIGQGYVRLTEDGHLQLLDYSLLASGTLAYQLGEDFSTSSGLSIEGLQEELEEYVNNRVAFPNVNQQTSSNNPDVINIYITLTDDEEDSGQSLNIVNIDSRFNTSIYVHLMGTAPTGTAINFIDCEKLRIDNQLSGDFTINSYRCRLYYDANILNELSTVTEMTLWYERYESADLPLIVNDMTVECVGTPTAVTNQEYWNTDAANDNHYSYALKSITFSHDGTIIGCSLLVTDDITANVALGRYLSVFAFKLPQSTGLPFPELKLRKTLKVSGTFTTTYPLNVNTPEGYVVKDTTFSAVSQNYDSSGVLLNDGMISFATTISHVSSVSGIDSTHSIDSWETGVFNIFNGGVVS